MSFSNQADESPTHLEAVGTMKPPSFTEWHRSRFHLQEATFSRFRPAGPNRFSTETPTKIEHTENVLPNTPTNINNTSRFSSDSTSSAYSELSIPALPTKPKAVVARPRKLESTEYTTLPSPLFSPVRAHGGSSISLPTIPPKAASARHRRSRSVHFSEIPATLHTSPVSSRPLSMSAPPPGSPSPPRNSRSTAAASATSLTPVPRSSSVPAMTTSNSGGGLSNPFCSKSKSKNPPQNQLFFELSPISHLIQQSLKDLETVRKVQRLQGEKEWLNEKDAKPVMQPERIDYDRVEKGLKEFGKSYEMFLKYGSQSGDKRPEVHFVSVVCKSSDIAAGKIGAGHESVPKIRIPDCGM